MTANSDDIYIKADRNIEVAKKSVTLGDVLKIECVNPAMLARIRSTHLLTFHHPDNKRERRVVMSVLKVIQKIHEIYPEASVENIGETDFIVTYEEQDGKGGVIHVAKIVMVVLISFFGAAFSTMAFNNDVGVTKMFGQIYELLTGTKSNGFTILEFMYCIGIIIGILTFFKMIYRRRLWKRTPERRKNWMWMKNIFLAILGLSAGITAAGGLFSFIIGLGVVSDFADRTHTGEHVMLYEDAIAVGGSIGAIISVYHPTIPYGSWLVPLAGLFGGIFVGCWAMALTEMLDLFPIFIRRIRLVRGIGAIIIGIAFGKGLGALLFFWKRW